jgi:hypothetical protein
MKLHFCKYLLSLILLLFLLSNCKKDKTGTLPALHFITEAGYTFNNDTIGIGETVKIGIRAEGISSAITNLVVTLETEYGTEIAVDSGIYLQNLAFTRISHYGASKYEKWTFTVMDKDRNRSSVSVILTKDPNSKFGAIRYFPNITIGLQNNTQFGNFFSDSTGLLYKADSTLNIQSLINFIAYYGDLNSPPTDYTFSSPNETDAPKYYPILSSYLDPKNEVRYKADSTSLHSADFDATYNDSTIIANYTAATTGKRKFKSARPGYVFAFQISVGPESGKRGLIRVNSTTGSLSGTINFDLKIQK